MSEPKRHKVESKEITEKEEVENRIFAATHLIKVDTTPPSYLPTLTIRKSSVIAKLICISAKDSEYEVNEYGDRFVLCLPSDNIPYETWKILQLLIDNQYKKGLSLTNNNTLDDLLYICFKYDIAFKCISDAHDSHYKKWTKLFVLIIEICELSHEQCFPRTKHIEHINTYYTDVLAPMLYGYITNTLQTKYRKSFVNRLRMVQPIYINIMRKASDMAWFMTDKYPD